MRRRRGGGEEAARRRRGGGEAGADAPSVIALYTPTSAAPRLPTAEGLERLLMSRASGKARHCSSLHVTSRHRTSRVREPDGGVPEVGGDEPGIDDAEGAHVVREELHAARLLAPADERVGQYTARIRARLH